jgi:hypothetical protein
MSETEGKQILDGMPNAAACLEPAQGVLCVSIRPSRTSHQSRSIVSFGWYEKDRALLPCVILASAATIAHLTNCQKTYASQAAI